MSIYDIKSFFAIGDMSIISMISQYFKEANLWWVCHYSVAGDAKLRKAFYRSAASQLWLLKTIGVSEMEKEFERKKNF